MSKKSGLLRPSVSQSDQTEYRDAKDRLIKAYCKRAHCENRILKYRREIEAIVKRINGHLTNDDRLDFEKFLPLVSSTPMRHTFSRESIKRISTLQGSLDTVKARINALLAENQQLRETVNRHSHCCGAQVSKLDVIINELTALREKEQELADCDTIPDTIDELTEVVQNDRDYEGSIDHQSSHTSKHDQDMSDAGLQLSPRVSSPTPIHTQAPEEPRTPLLEPPHYGQNQEVSTEQLSHESLEPRTPLNENEDAPETTSHAPVGSVSSRHRE
ncbi:hypothetical protein BWQ96_01227 [Gracilariopsis chorda]|uniref:Uncharacterized protein n=1 Tax=Gracilariopsis chorda TaxID=448386 RepID=A0A2V3J3Y5_9FLOR|nr:hypothetical protein BWQ96_01227 [Gracilariopsis chorda]|eukprot:PXF49089.1 hypothetical protein BWQ96_01227 [Gracilariopsis chorda]